MSIIYEALKKIEKKGGQNRFSFPYYASKNIFIVSMAMVGFFAFAITYMFFSKKTPYTHEMMKKTTSTFSLSQEESNEARPAVSEGVQKKEEREKYCLQGIIYDEESPLAFINGKRVSIGKQIDDALVVNISGDGVELKTPQGNKYIYIE